MGCSVMGWGVVELVLLNVGGCVVGWWCAYRLFGYRGDLGSSGPVLVFAIRVVGGPWWLVLGWS